MKKFSLKNLILRNLGEEISIGMVQQMARGVVRANESHSVQFIQKFWADFFESSDQYYTQN